MKKILMRGGLTTVLLAGMLTFLYAAHSATATSQKNVDASVLFDKHCDSCHGKDGQAKTFKAKFNHARNLTDSKWQAEVTDERLFVLVNAWGMFGSSVVSSGGNRISRPGLFTDRSQPLWFAVATISFAVSIVTARRSRRPTP